MFGIALVKKLARALLYSRLFSIYEIYGENIMPDLLRLPVGIENFAEIIEDNYYYVDKTSLIEQILNDGTKVSLFTRPRRFGKSLNISIFLRQTRKVACLMDFIFQKIADFVINIWENFRL